MFGFIDALDTIVGLMHLYINSVKFCAIYFDGKRKSSEFEDVDVYILISRILINVQSIVKNFARIWYR